MKTIILSFIAIVLISFKLSAQDQKSAPVEQTAAASSAPALGSFESSYAYSPFTFDGKKMNIQQVGGTLTLPVINHLKDGKLDFLLIGVGYNGLFLSGFGSQFGGSAFHSFSAPITFQKALSSKYAIVASFIPTLSSDLKDISGDDMLYSGAVMLRVRSSDKFSYSVGAAYSKQFFGSVLIPVVGIDWQITDKLSFSGTLPVSQKLNYQLSGKSAFGIDADFGIGGGTYRLSKKMNSDYFQVQQLKASLFYKYAISKSFSIEASGGYNFMQQLDLYSKDEKVNWVPFNDLNKRVPITELKKTGIAVQTGFSYRF